MQSSIFLKGGTAFALIAFFLFLAKFMMSGKAVVSARDKAEAWQVALSNVWIVFMFLAILSFANLLPGPIEQLGAGVTRGLLDFLKPVASKIPGMQGLY